MVTWRETCLKNYQKTILHIMERRWLNDFCLEMDNYPALLIVYQLRMIKISLELVKGDDGSAMAIYVNRDQGLYKRSRYWFRQSIDAQNRNNCLALHDTIKKFTTSNGIGFIDQTYRGVRARNDAHHNI